MGKDSWYHNIVSVMLHNLARQRKMRTFNLSLLRNILAYLVVMRLAISFYSLFQINYYQGIRGHGRRVFVDPRTSMTQPCFTDLVFNLVTAVTCLVPNRHMYQFLFLLTGTPNWKNELSIQTSAFIHHPSGAKTGMCRENYVNTMAAKSFFLHDDIIKYNPPATNGFPSRERPVTQSFDVFFGLRLSKRLSKHSRSRWFQTPSHSLWRHCNVTLPAHEQQWYWLFSVTCLPWRMIPTTWATMILRYDNLCKNMLIFHKIDSVR